MPTGESNEQIAQRHAEALIRASGLVAEIIHIMKPLAAELKAADESGNDALANAILDAKERAKAKAPYWGEVAELMDRD